MDGTTSLSRRGAASVLTIMGATGGRPVIIKDLLSVNNHAQIRNMVGAFEQDGLATIAVGTSEHKTIQIRLTPLGEEAAAAVGLIARFISKPVGETCLDMRHFATLVVRLRQNGGESPQKRLLEAVPSYNAVVNVVEAMEADGLATVQKNPGNGRVTVGLTSLGDTCAGIYTTLDDKIKAYRRNVGARPRLLKGF